MISNILGMSWDNGDLRKIRDNLPQGFELKLYNLAHKCVIGKSITFRERFAESMTITYGDQFENINLSSGISYICYRFEIFIKQNAPKNKQPKNIDTLRETTIKNIKSALNINNDVISYDKQKMSFELNLYTPIERKRILALLTTVDELVPEIFIDITLNNSTIEQLNALSDRLIEVEVIL